MLFYIGCSPSAAAKILNCSEPAAGVMISYHQLKKRQSDFLVSNWILDSGAFTEVSRWGRYRTSPSDYVKAIARWSCCGKLLAAVSQDYMCEPFVLDKTGLTVAEHQRLTIERYDSITALASRAALSVPILPVLQGYQSSDYIHHLLSYGDRLYPGCWVGVGSVCRRNSNPGEVLNILKSIKLLRPDLRLHGFGLKLTALENKDLASLLYSSDSMAWSYPLKFRRSQPVGDNVQNQYRPSVVADDNVQNQSRLSVAYDYQSKVSSVLSGASIRSVPSTAGAGNGQGRKPKWKSPTKPLRIPSKYHDKVIQLCKYWETLD